MTYTQGIVLGLVQGVTEFLPISSSGHLILVPVVFGWPDQGLEVDAVIHLGTLAALVAYFRGELRAMVASLGGGRDRAGPRRLALVLLVATVPAAVAGLLLGDPIERHLRLPAVVATSTIGWGLVMLVADRMAVPGPRMNAGEQNVDWGRGLLVGCAQALALIPGTSRSGITITAGLASGLDRPTAARFAFLLGIPVTAGAGLLKGLELVDVGVPVHHGGPLAAAMLTAFASGWASVWFLVHHLKRRSLAPFVAYRVVLGLVIVALLD
jgi:undecaprenyl-diphosphatase